MSKKLSIEVWSDIACPWCYVGKRRLEHALAQFPHRDSVQLVWRAFELDPSAPALRDSDTPYVERLARKYGTPVPQAQAMIQRIVDTGAAEGLALNFDHIRPGNTFNAHRLIHLAKERGLQNELKERLLSAYFSEGRAIGDADTLHNLTVAVGLDSDEVQGVLSTDLYANEVRADEAEARDIGVSGVPFFLLGRRYAVSGAQSSELLLEAITKAWHELPASSVT